MKTLLPPIAAKRPHKISVHGETWTDNYFWLKEKTSPEVIRYLNAENDYTAKVMKPYGDLAAKLNREMVRRIVEDDESAPVKIGENFYYVKQRKGFQYEIYCRKAGSLRATEHVILDLNELARGRKYMRLGDFELSPDQRLLAYSTDTKGDELFTIRIKDLVTGKLLSDKIEGAYYSMAWSKDNRCLFYTKVDAALRPYRVWKHVVGTPTENDVLIWEEPDERFTIAVETSKDHEFLFIHIHSMVTSEVRYLADGGTSDKLRVVAPRHQDIEYSVVHRSGLFYIRINDKGRNFRLVSTPVDHLSKGNWKEILPHDPAVCLEGMDEFAGHLAIEAKENGLTQILIHNCKSAKNHKVRFPEPAYGVKIEPNPNFESNLLRFVYSSMVTPASVFDYQMNTKRRELKKQDRVRGGYHPDK